MNETSLSLLGRVQHDPAAPDWRRFTELYEPLIRGWLRRKDCLSQDADDVVQNILAVIVRRLNDFEHNGRTGRFAPGCGPSPSIVSGTTGAAIGRGRQAPAAAICSR